MAASLPREMYSVIAAGSGVETSCRSPSGQELQCQEKCHAFGDNISGRESICSQGLFCCFILNDI